MMNNLEFLRAVWPEQGYYCLDVAVVLDDGSKIHKHKVFQTIEAAEAVARHAGDKSDVYFCINTLAEPSVKNETTGKTQWRIHTNMKEARCFFLDLDVGDGDGKYASQHDAALALKAFCKKTQLPRPIIVSSGGGLHVYWPLVDAMTTMHWKPWATRLLRLCQAHGFLVDKTRVDDQSSVLRVPGTFNHKGGDKRPVVIATEGEPSENVAFLEILSAACDAMQVDTNVVAKAPIIANSGGNLDKIYDGKVPSPKAVYDACEHMRTVFNAGGCLPYEQWHKTLTVIRATEGGEKLCHKISKLNYKGYSEAETNQKLRDQDGMGPLSCATMDRLFGGDACSRCKWQGAVSGPAHAGIKPQQAPAPVVSITPVAPGVAAEEIVCPPPSGYIRAVTGQIFLDYEDEGGKPVQKMILDHDLFPLCRQTNQDLKLDQHTWRTTLPHEGQKDFLLSSSSLHDGKELAKALSNEGVYVDPNKVNDVRTYMSHYIRSLQKLAAAQKQNTHLGWTNDYQSFVLADKVVHADGSETPALLSSTAETVALGGRQMHKKGTLAKQIELLKYYALPSMIPQQFFILTGLGALLLHMTGHHGAIVHAQGETGGSKSTSLFTAGSFWGMPEGYVMSGRKGGATLKAREETIATLCNLPIGLDEITNMHPDDAKEFALSMSQIGGRETMTADRKMRLGTGGTSKSTITMTTANKSLHGLLSEDNAAGAAGSMRVIELDFKKCSNAGKPEADAYFRALSQNYGWIGEEFVKYVVRNYASVALRVQEMVRKIDAHSIITGGERFYSAVFACNLIAGIICAQLGLLSFDMKAMRIWLLEVQLPKMRGILVDEYTTPLNTLASYLDEIQADVFIIQGSGSNLSPTRYPRGAARGRIENEHKLMWISRDAFRTHCIKKSISSRGCIATLVEQKVIVNAAARKVLGSDTESPGAQTYCYLIDMRHPEIAGKVMDIMKPIKGGIPGPSPVRQPPKAAKPDLKLVENT